jgi:hypothetical protein
MKPLILFFGFFFLDVLVVVTLAVLTNVFTGGTSLSSMMAANDCAFIIATGALTWSFINADIVGLVALMTGSTVILGVTEGSIATVSVIGSEAGDIALVAGAEVVALAVLAGLVLTNWHRMPKTIM